MYPRTTGKPENENKRKGKTKMNFTTRRIAFAIATTPIVLGAYALVLIVLGGTPDLFANAWVSVALGWALGFAPAVAIAKKVVA